MRLYEVTIYFLAKSLVFFFSFLGLYSLKRFKVNIFFIYTGLHFNSVNFLINKSR